VNLKSGFYLKLFFKPEMKPQSTSASRQTHEDNIQIHLIAMRIEFRPSDDPNKPQGPALKDNSRQTEQLKEAAEKQPATSLRLPFGTVKGPEFPTLQCRINDRIGSTIHDTSNYRFNIIAQRRTLGVNPNHHHHRGHHCFHAPQAISESPELNNSIDRHRAGPQMKSKPASALTRNHTDQLVNITAESQPTKTINSFESSNRQAEHFHQLFSLNSKHAYFGEEEKIESVTSPHMMLSPAMGPRPAPNSHGYDQSLEQNRGTTHLISRLVKPQKVLVTATEACNSSNIDERHPTDSLQPGR
jgi:hypothetical protein